ncbi:MAG TPA: alkaline phosphatase family protein [Blastocatellia bacterium]|nr:alkaline phosphatase family protein [Blastocatellia bacterium]
MKKVIVIGLDGFEPKIVERLLNQGALPHLARLRAQGGCARLQTTYPAQTPVAWSSFATGTNPGGHGIFDFIRRDPKTYLPDLSFNRYERKNAFLPPRAVNLRRGTAVWELLSQAGIPSIVLRFPCTYPPDKINGRMLSGMGVPDLRGGLGTSTFLTANEHAAAQESEQVIHVTTGQNGAIETYLSGPRDPKTKAETRLPFTISIDASRRSALLRSDGEPATLELSEGCWSDWLRVKFKTGLFQSVRGLVRFYLVRAAPVLELYASPISFDPDAPLFTISSPPDYAAELRRAIGAFYTTGMPEDHNGLSNGRFDEEAFLQQCELVRRERERMMLYELERFTEGFFYCLFDSPDRVQHLFWPRDEAHPHWRVIEDHYRACDELIGRALAFADDETLFVTCSDHGMNSFERGFHLNTWLHDQGLLRLKRGLRPGEAEDEFLRHVDWDRTRAYALGLGGIYLNIKGREERGIVTADEVEPLKSAIVIALSRLPDPARNRIAIRSVAARQHLYSGPYATEAPDLLVNFAAGWRASWATALGGVPAGHFEDNHKKWSGDHIIDPALVPGVLLMNRHFRTDNPGLIDLAPTILKALGQPSGPLMEGSSLL